MKGDFSRITFDRTKHYNGVLMQQGRVQLDADWNEYVQMQQYLGQTEAKDAIGLCGVPRLSGGFDIGPDISGAVDLTISAGRIYVHGLLCELEADLSYLTQSDYPNPPAIDPSEGRIDLAYIDVWQRGITAVEDPLIREEALEGPDTAVRTKTVWQVKIIKGVENIDCEADIKSLLPAQEGGRLSTRLTEAPEEQPCIIAPASGYRGLENHLYRVEIHDGGEPYSWPRQQVMAADIDSIEGRTPGPYQIKVNTSDWTLLSGRIGQVLEIFSDQTNALGSDGPLVRVSALDDASHTLTVVVLGSQSDLSTMTDQAHLSLRGVATFKWSRDNGSILFPIEEFVSGEPAKVVVEHLGFDQFPGLNTGDWVQVQDDESELQGRPGTLAQVVDMNPGSRLVTLSADVSGHSGKGHPKLRRWDKEQEPLPLPIISDAIALEDGIEVQFSGNGFRSNDFWTFSARTITADIERLTDAPPQGIVHHYCALAYITWKEIDSKWEPQIQDCRSKFPALTDICARDVCFDDSSCGLADAKNVQDALDRLCLERDLRHHNRHLHGWGIVCGLKVSCGPSRDSEVTIGKGYAIDCKGNDILLGEDEVIRDLIQQIEAMGTDGSPLNQEGNGEVCITLELDEQGQRSFRLVKYEPPGKDLQSLLGGTLLLSFYQDCIKKVQDFLKEELTPGGEEGLPAGPAQQRLSSLTNLLAQPISPRTGQRIYISPQEHSIMKEFYAKLRALLQSETFCAMFKNARPFPDYPFSNPGLDTIFGKGQHTRLRLRPNGLEAYTVGSGLDPRRPSTTINRYDLTRNVMTAEINPLTGGEVRDCIGDSGAGSVQDVAFSPGGDRIYAVISSKNDANTIFRAGSFKRDGSIGWGPVINICGVKLVTLATTAADPNNVYAIGLKNITITNQAGGSTRTEKRGAGIFKINPDAVDPNMAPVREFNSSGHLKITGDGMAFATFQKDNVQPDTYNGVRVLRLPTLSIDSSIDLVQSGQDDLAVLSRVIPPGGIIYTLYVLVGPVQSQKFIRIYKIDGQSGRPVGDLKQLEIDNSTIRLEPYAPTGMLLVTLEDGNCLRMMDISAETMVKDYILPMQVGPISIVSDAQKKQACVLNYASNTITLVAGRLLNPQFHFDFETLAKYRKGVIEAFADLLAGFLQYLKDCLCHHFLVNCPECDEEDKIYLACLSIRSGQLYKVCNFSRRRYVKSFPTVDYWLSLLPVAPLFKMLIEKFCCTILPDFFSQYKAQDFQQDWLFEPVTRPTLAGVRQGIATAQMTDLSALIRDFLNKGIVARKLISDSMIKGPSEIVPEHRTALSSSEMVDQPSADVEARLKERGITVHHQPYRPSPAPDLFGFFRAPAPGKEVTLFEEDGKVRYYSVSDKGPAISEETRRLEGEVITLRATVSQLQKTADEAMSIRKQEMLRLEETIASLKTDFAEMGDLKQKVDSVLRRQPS
jgi:hypothetical protein